MEKTSTVDQKLAAVEALIASRPDLFARQGAVVATWRTVGHERLGPYYSIRYRDVRRQQSLYLGTSADLARKVGLLLENAQKATRQQRALAHARAAVLAALRHHKRRLRRELECLGLTLKGFELRRLKHVEAAVTPIQHDDSTG